MRKLLLCTVRFNTTVAMWLDHAAVEEEDVEVVMHRRDRPMDSPSRAFPQHGRVVVVVSRYLVVVVVKAETANVTLRNRRRL